MGGLPRLLLCAPAGDGRGLPAAAAAVAVAATPLEGASGSTLLLDLRAGARPPRGTVLASAAARELESTLREQGRLRGAARGRLCFAVANDAEPAAALEAALGEETGAGLVVAICDRGDFRTLLDAGADFRRSVLIRAEAGANRPLIALLAAEMRDRGIPLKAWVAPIGAIGGRRALAGLEPGGASGRRAQRLAGALVPGAAGGLATARPGLLRAERAQALPAVLAVAIVIVAIALILVAIGGAATAKGRLQRSADLAALSAARSMHDDLDRLFVPATLPSGLPNPAHLSRGEYLGRARGAAAVAAERNGVAPGLLEVRFPDGGSFAPLRVRVRLEAQIGLGGEEGGLGAAETAVAAEAEVALAVATESGAPAMASGGGYSGPLAYRQGKPMRPDVAAAFDRMAAAAGAAGVTLVINSAYRSDAEQQRLWNANPDPRWVAPPGTSLHRCGTELDLGPASAYGWLAANAERFGFTRRYSWEAWHYGYAAGPAPCSAAGDRVGAGAEPDGRGAGGPGLPGFVPARFRGPLLAAAARYDVSAALLAAQLMAESNFNPNAVSPAGAQGIAQFMPATAAAYGLRDPFDPVAAIAAQARLMSELLGQFGSVELALAAYNAGPGAVSACDCVPPYPETQAYVARILALLDGAGALPGGPPALEVRLIA
jgi:hypothetical protein